ncbi:MAG TPA: COQ9 family protein [Caulobacteraceae bacterium]|jgi:ubiquinone biosynthesis protein COQ9|nr:COQ9 family protein [Caulobacteraceae bacterium]
MNAAAPAEPSWAEAAEARVLDAAIGLAPRLGWGRPLVVRAAREAGLSPADTALLLPGGGRDLAALLSRRHDARALEALAEVDPLGLKVRERIRRAVEARVAAAAEDEAAVRRCAAWLALAPRLPLALSLLWESADVLWRWAGDTATDENHYSKRAILSGVLATTVGVRFERGAAAASEHLAAQIDRVMSFEKWKAGLPKLSETLAAIAAALGRMRYGAAEPPVSPTDP